jgi:hypothetical protein
MKKLIKIGFMLILTLTVFVGCRTAPIRDYESSYVTASSQVSLDKVAKEIIAAGVGLGWQMKKVNEGVIIGTLFLRAHMAQVKITYTANTYNIIYQNSSNLKYDATNRTIHSNYNGWIQNLNNAIQTRLGML